MHDEYRGRGIGRQMLAVMEEAMAEDGCYCLPFAHLVDFYGSIGFVPIQVHAAPPHLQERLRLYVSIGMDVLVMRRPGGKESSPSGLEISHGNEKS